MKFDVNKLSSAIEKSCPEIAFAILHGSAKDGNVKKGSDIDIALFLNQKPKFNIYSKVIEVIETNVPGPEVDVGILNGTEPVYRFEALKGKLLFCRDKEKYLNFFSLACREYEDQMADYERQHSYRKNIPSTF